ncbi:MAG: NAD(P)-binding domain-containing protein [Actinomycetota bacterium]
MSGAPGDSNGSGRYVPVVVIGAGQAGLAASACLSARGLEHVLLERHVVAHSWKHERWASLRLLTPNWMTQLPHLDPAIVRSEIDHDPDGFDRADQLAKVLEDYAAAISAPVVEGVSVESVRAAQPDPTAPGDARPQFVVESTDGVRTCDAVVIASGACVSPAIPTFASSLPDHVTQITPTDYRSPDELAPGDVLVVGASASGTQLADELQRAGRSVTLSTWHHRRMVRRYRGRDIFWWLHESGDLHRPADLNEADAPPPSMQLVGSPDHRDLDLNALIEHGVRVAGSMAGIDGHLARFNDDLAATAAAADRAMFDQLAAIDAWIESSQRIGEFDPPERVRPTCIADPIAELDLTEIGVVIWATGFRPHFPFLPDDWRTETGAVRHRGGVGERTGVFVLGMPYNRTRSSNFISGVGPDAEVVADAISRRLAVHADR